MQVTDLKPYTKIALADDQKVICRTVEKLVPSDLTGWVFVYLVGESTPELLREDMPLTPDKSVVYLANY
jgi:hypothetical protein